MKILHVFDSLKFLRTIFVAVACALVLYPGHAELRDDELPNGYKRLTDVVFDGNTYYETNQILYGTDTLTVRLSNTNTSGQNVIGAYSGTGNSARNFSLYVYGNGSSSNAYLRHGTILSRPNYGTGARTLIIGPTGTSGFAENTTYSAETFETTDTFWIGGLPNSSSSKYTGNIVGNIAVGDRLKYIPCERVSDGEIGYYETVNKVFLENQGSGTPTTSGYDTSHMVEVPIKIATTHYNETHFTPVETRLDAARTVINDLITQMQTNAVNVSKLAVEKQTRPNTDCPAGKNCLLVTDPTGAENWYEIIGANAVQSSSNVPDYFSFTTSPLNAGDSVSFYLSPSGTFTVDWGDGSVPQVIERALEDSNEYSHSYANAGPKTIKITGRATGYSTRVLSFGNTSQIASIDGCLGAIFPTLGNGAGQQPKFSGTFAGTQITSIPENLFSGVTGAAERMFEQTFIGTQITSIPAGLFSGITDAAEYMFYNTFAGTQITSIPAGLFSDITGVAEYTFFQTFAGCSNLTGYIPESAFAGLISAGSPDTSDFMQYIFVNSTGLATACPQNMTEVSTPYKSTYWETRNGNYAVMCRPN